jgi:hypothetical protein
MFNISKIFFYIIICSISLSTIYLLRHICKTGEIFSAIVDSNIEYFLCFPSPISKNESVLYFLPLNWFFIFLFFHFLFFLFFPCFHIFFDKFYLEVNKENGGCFYKNLFGFLFLFLFFYNFGFYFNMEGKLRSFYFYIDNPFVVFLFILLFFCFGFLVSYYNLYKKFSVVFLFFDSLLFSFCIYCLYFIFRKSFFIPLLFLSFFVLFLFFIFSKNVKIYFPFILPFYLSIIVLYFFFSVSLFDFYLADSSYYLVTVDGCLVNTSSFGVNISLLKEILDDFAVSCVFSYSDLSTIDLDLCVDYLINKLLQSLHAPHLLHTQAIDDLKRNLLDHISRQDVQLANQKIIDFVHFIYEHQDIVYNTALF